MSEQREGLRLVVKAKGARDSAWWVDNPVVIPRCGEFVQFDDGRGRVESVTWDVKAKPKATVTVDCVPVAALDEKQGPSGQP